jgi:DNA-binding transcriptional LysR family regulator
VAERIMAEHPAVNIELISEQRLVELAGEGYDAGVRLGERVEKDMIAVRIGPDLRMCVAAAPGYFDTHGRPQTPRDLIDHNCINLRLPTLGGLYAWEFEKDGHPLNVRVEGQFTANDPELILDAALAGRALACLPSDHVGPLVRQGALALCLEDWCPPFPGYHLYYPSRRQPSPAFRLLVEALRYRGA